MSQQGGNLPMDVEGSSSSGGAGSAGMAGSSSGSLAHAVGNNNSRLKSASPMAVFGTGDKGEGKDELAKGEGARDDAARDGSGVAGSNSKSIKSSSDGRDIQDHVAKDSPTPAVGDGGSDSGKGKGKHIDPVGDHALHIWTLGDRRKKMKSVFNSLHSLLPRLPPKADKANIVGESVDYIKALEDTLQGLERLKLERREDALNYCSVSVAPVRHLHLRCAMEAHQQTLCTPNIEVRMVGNKSFIGVSAPRQPGAVTKALCVLEKYLIDVVEIKIISCDQNRIMFFIRTCINIASTEITEGAMTIEDRYNLFMSELMQYITK